MILARNCESPLFAKSKSLTRTIRGLVRALREGRLVVPDYQRGRVWTEAQRASWVGYALTGAPLPALFIRGLPATDSSQKAEEELVDGQQRLLAIRDWLDEKFEAVLPTGEAVGRTGQQDINVILRRGCPVVTLPENTDRIGALQTYLAINTGGSPHTEVELSVAKMLLDCETQGFATWKTGETVWDRAYQTVPLNIPEPFALFRVTITGLGSAVFKLYGAKGNGLVLYRQVHGKKNDTTHLMWPEQPTGAAGFLITNYLRYHLDFRIEVVHQGILKRWSQFPEVCNSLGLGHFPISKAARNRLRRVGLADCGELLDPVKLTRKGIGPKTRNEIMRVLSTLGELP